VAIMPDLTTIQWSAMIWRMNTEVKTSEPKITRQMTLAEFDRMFPDETACRAYLMAQRWPNGVRCPRCGNEKVYAGKAKPWTWECKKCGAGKSAYRFSVIAGTIFENTNYKLLIGSRFST
jgi:ribosomal protein L37AE/L43A